MPNSCGTRKLSFGRTPNHDDELNLKHILYTVILLKISI